MSNLALQEQLDWVDENRNVDLDFPLFCDVTLLTIPNHEDSVFIMESNGQSVSQIPAITEFWENNIWNVFPPKVPIPILLFLTTVHSYHTYLTHRISQSYYTRTRILESASFPYIYKYMTYTDNKLQIFINNNHLKITKQLNKPKQGTQCKPKRLQIWDSCGDIIIIFFVTMSVNTEVK